MVVVVVKDECNDDRGKTGFSGAEMAGSFFVKFQKQRRAEPNVILKRRQGRHGTFLRSQSRHKKQAS